jgi:hypothetical protein
MGALTAMVLGCGAASTPTAATAASSPAQEERLDDGAPQRDPRLLGPDATFADLVAAARALDDAGAGERTADCLLRSVPTDDAVRLEAQVTPAVRPLSSPPDRIDAATAGAPLALLSPWGRAGSPDAVTVLVTFTDTPPMGTPMAMALTHDGIRMMGRPGEGQPPDAALSVEDALTFLEGHTGADVWVVTAAAGVPVRTLHDWLRRLPGDAPPVALAVPLPPGTRLPDEPQAATPDAALCEGGLAPPAANTSQGDMDAAAARQALMPLHDALPQCASADPSIAGREARLGLYLRVGEAGQVVDACITADSVGSPWLRRCVLAAAMGLQFPRPQPAGVVDLALPVAFHLEVDPAPRPVCSD